MGRVRACQKITENIYCIFDRILGSFFDSMKILISNLLDGPMNIVPGNQKREILNTARRQYRSGTTLQT